MISRRPNPKLNPVFKRFSVEFPDFTPRGIFIFKCIEGVYLGGCCFDSSRHAGNEAFRYVHVFCDHLFDGVVNQDIVSLEVGDLIRNDGDDWFRILGCDLESTGELSRLIFEVRPYLEMMSDSEACHNYILRAPYIFAGTAGYPMNPHWHHSLLVGALWLGRAEEARSHYDNLMALPIPEEFCEWQFAVRQKCTHRIQALKTVGIQGVRAELEMERRARIESLGAEGLCY